MKKLNRIAAAAMMLLVAVTSNAQVVQNEEQIYGRWRIVMTEEISLLLSLEEGGNGSVALSMSEDETDGVILVVMDGKWGFNNDTISINPDVQTVRLQYFGADETMKQMISAIPEEQRQELASALAEEAIEEATFKFLRSNDEGYIVTRIKATDPDEVVEEGDDEEDEDETSELMMIRLTK